MEDTSVNVIFIILQQALGKEAALGLCRTHSANDNHRGNSVNIGEWASNVQGETMTFFFFFNLFLLPILCLVCHTRHVSLLSVESYCANNIKYIGVRSCIWSINTTSVLNFHFSFLERKMEIREGIIQFMASWNRK